MPNAVCVGKATRLCILRRRHALRAAQSLCSAYCPCTLYCPVPTYHCVTVDEEWEPLHSAHQAGFSIDWQLSHTGACPAEVLVHKLQMQWHFPRWYQECNVSIVLCSSYLGCATIMMSGFMLRLILQHQAMCLKPNQSFAPAHDIVLKDTMIGIA